MCKGGAVEAMKVFSLKEDLIIIFENEEDIMVERTGIIYVVPAWNGCRKCKKSHCKI